MFSVTISAYDQHDVTAVHVRECMNCTVMPDEIIVVNDGGAPDLKEKLQALELKTEVIYARINEDIAWNYTGARNLAFWLSRGDYISMEDNDNIPGPNAYESALEKIKDYGRVLYGRRSKVARETAITKPSPEWESLGARPRHQDTQLLRRDVVLTVKGCDERFAGRYAWANSDWRRRLDRAGVESTAVSDYFWTVYDGETVKCECTDVPHVDGFCKKCGRPRWRKSYKNYNMARKGEHTQSPIGMLNFTYEYETL